MFDHYGLTEIQFKKLEKQGVTLGDLFKSVPLFDPAKTGEVLSQINLYHYIDLKGNFNDPPFTAHKKIAKAMFENLSNKEKLNVLGYLEAKEDNFIEDNQDD